MWYQNRSISEPACYISQREAMETQGKVLSQKELNLLSFGADPQRALGKEDYSTAGEKERIEKQSTEKENQAGGRITQRIFILTNYNRIYKDSSSAKICAWAVEPRKATRLKCLIYHHMDLGVPVLLQDLVSPPTPSVPKDSEHTSMHSCASGSSFCKISSRKGADPAEHPLNSSNSKHSWSESGHTEMELEALG